MNWFICLVLFALSPQLQAADGLKKELRSNCTEYFINHEEYRLDTKRVPGLWYQVTDHPELIFCLDFKSLTDEDRHKISAEIKPYTTMTDLSRFSLISKRRCPGVETNDTEFHLLAQHGDQGIFDLFSIPHNRRFIGKDKPITIKMKLVEAENETYMLVEDSRGICLLMTHKPNKHYTEDKIKVLLSKSNEIRLNSKDKQ